MFDDYAFESVLSSRIAMGGSVEDPMIAVLGETMTYRDFVRYLMDYLNSNYHTKDQFTEKDDNRYRVAIHRLMEGLRKKPDPRAAFFRLINDIEVRFEELNTDMSTIMLSNVGPVRRVVGEPVKGAGYFGHTAGLHTVSIRLANFRGRISFEATISAEPGDADWFPVSVDGAGKFLEYPLNGIDNQTGTFGYTFRGNYVWLRATMDRTHFTPENATEEYLMQYGRLDAIKVL